MTGLIVMLAGCSTPPTETERSKAVLAIPDGMTISGNSVSQDGKPTATVRVQGAAGAQVFLCPWSEELTVAQAIAMAGGYSTPPVSTAQILRGSEVIPLDLKTLDREAGMLLRPDDTIELK